MEDIKVGDIVYFKTGNIPMTVLAITISSEGKPLRIDVVFVRNNKQIQDSFHIDTLTKIKPI